MSSRIPSLLDDSAWPAILAQLLEGTEPERRRAHEVLWVQVRHFVVHVVRLRIGSLGDDADVRRDLAVKVMERLKRRRWEQVRLWRANAARRTRVTWWAYIATLAQTAAIDEARRSRQRLSRRGSPYLFANEVPLDALDFLETRTESDIAEYLITLIDLRREAAKRAGEVKPTGDANGNGRPRARGAPGANGEDDSGER